MADILSLAPGEKDIAKIVAVVNELVRRVMPSEDAAAGALQAANNLSDVASASAARGNLGLGALATKSTVATGDIDNDAVTNAKAADMATKTYKGRTSGGTGDPEDVAAATVRADIDAEKIGEVAGINTQTGSYAFVLADKGKTVEMNVGSANNLTVPPNSSVAFPVGTYINVTQMGTGQTTLVAGGGVTIRAYNSALKLAGQYAMATLYKRATDEWVAGGNLVA